MLGQSLIWGKAAPKVAVASADSLPPRVNSSEESSAPTGEENDPKTKKDTKKHGKNTDKKKREKSTDKKEKKRKTQKKKKDEEEDDEGEETLAPLGRGGKDEDDDENHGDNDDDELSGLSEILDLKDGKKGKKIEKKPAAKGSFKRPAKKKTLGDDDEQDTSHVTVGQGMLSIWFEMSCYILMLYYYTWCLTTRYCIRSYGKRSMLILLGFVGMKNMLQWDIILWYVVVFYWEVLVCTAF